jgi:gluconate 2-dehydrogenase gamma chain
MSISRRDLIKSLSLTAAAGSMLQVVPLAAAETAHRLVSAHKAASSSGEYVPKFFREHQYKTLRALCQTIIPTDQGSGGAIEAGAPEFLDLLSSENKNLQLQLGGGIMWLDATCMERYGQTYLQCAPGQQTEMLDLIFMKHAARASTLLLGGFLAMTSSCVRAAGQGGGHGGSGGHGLGGHGGHLSGGSSSGHSSGHSIGHSFAHIFGHHGQGVSPTALKGAPPEHGKVTPSLEPVPRVLDRLPRNRFVSGPPICFFPRRRAFGLGGCPYGWVERDFSFGGNWNCSNDGFFFDPFFSAWFSGPVPYGSAFGDTTWFRDGTAPDSTVQSPAEPNPIRPQIRT